MLQDDASVIFLRYVDIFLGLITVRPSLSYINMAKSAAAVRSRRRQNDTDSSCESVYGENGQVLYSVLYCKTQNPRESVGNQHRTSVTKTFLCKRCACHLLGETRKDEFLIPTICLFKQLLLDIVPCYLSNTHHFIFPVERELIMEVYSDIDTSLSDVPFGLRWQQAERRHRIGEHPS